MSKGKRILLKQQYLSRKTNYVICLFRKKISDGDFFYVIDLAARKIVGHCYKNVPLNIQDIIECLDAIIKHRSFVKKIKIINLDRESLFKDEQYYEFLSRQKIEISRGFTNGRENQVIERTCTTIKNIMEKLLANHSPIRLSISGKDELVKRDLNTQEIRVALQKSIETYNNKPHKALYLLTPNQMEETLFKHAQPSHNIDGPQSSEHDEPRITLDACDIDAYKKKVISNYEGDWARFFIDFRSENNEYLKKILGQHDSLYKQNLNLERDLTFVRKEVEVTRNQRMKAEERKQKRQKAQKHALRDSIKPNEFKLILESIKANGFIPARKRTAFILLYCTGLRVSNLLFFSINHVRELMDRGKTYISLNKGGASRHPIALSTQGKRLLTDYIQDFTLLMADKEGTQPFFTTKNQLKKPINRSSFDNELNAILKQASRRLNKHIRTHSFRATIISELLETTPIQVVRDLMGHRSIKTTVQYNRNKVTSKQLAEVLASMDKTRTTT